MTMRRRHPTKSIINGVVARDKRTTTTTTTTMTTFASSAPHSSASQHQNREREREEFDGTTSPPGEDQLVERFDYVGAQFVRSNGKAVRNLSSKNGTAKKSQEKNKMALEEPKTTTTTTTTTTTRRRRRKTGPGYTGREILARR